MCAQPGAGLLTHPGGVFGGPFPFEWVTPLPGSEPDGWSWPVESLGPFAEVPDDAPEVPWLGEVPDDAPEVPWLGEVPDDAPEVPWLGEEPEGDPVGAEDGEVGGEEPEEDGGSCR